MKKILFSFFLISSTVIIICSAQIKEWAAPEKTVSKSLHLTIVHADNYLSRGYRNSSAMLNVVVISLKGHTMDTLLVRDYNDFKLSDLSSYAKKFNLNINVPNVADKKEKIIFIYNVVYNTKESQLVIPTVNYIGNGERNDKFIVSI